MAILFAILFLFATPAFAANPVDTCNAQGNGPCTLPCGNVTSTPVQLLGVNNQRAEFIISNTGSTTLYLIMGRGNAGQDWTYGIPLAPFGQAGSTLDFEIQPDPSKGLHTWTSSIAVTTQTGTGSCVYGEQAN